MMKKILTLCLSVSLVFGIAACGNSAGNSGSSTVQPSSGESEAESVDRSEDADTAAGDTALENSDENTDALVTAEPESGKTLVVYYSASGNTARVAQDIANAAGADLFEIVPEEPYTDADLDWTDDNSRVSREHDDESLRDVPLATAEVPDWDSYDTVFIGYPIWWGIAAWPTDSFVKANDFTGKTVIPFATSSSSGMGQSGSLLAELAGTGNWQDGERFPSGVSSDDVAAWVDGLGLE